MGLMDDVTKMAGLAGGGAVSGQGALLEGVVKMLGSGESGGGGGLAGLVQSFQTNGLGDVVASWVGTGQNLPVSADQVTKGLGAGRVEQLAQAAGLPDGVAASALASLLPTIVDRLTPGGAMPQGAQLQSLLGSVKSMLGA